MLVDKNDYLPAIADDVLVIGHIPSVETISLGLAVMAININIKYWLKLIFQPLVISPGGITVQKSGNIVQFLTSDSDKFVDDRMVQRASFQSQCPESRTRVGFMFKMILRNFMDENVKKYPFCMVKKGKFWRQIPMSVTTLGEMCKGSIF